MANRNFASGGKIYSNVTMPVMINCKITIAGTGAVASITTNSLVKSVSRTSTGIYVVHLRDNYNSLVIAQGSTISPVSGLSGVLAVETANAPQPQIQSSSDPRITIKCLDAAGALVDPASGSIVCVIAIADNSSIKA